MSALPVATSGPLHVPARGLIAVIGADGSDPAGWAARHFAPEEVLDLGTFRAWVGGDAAGGLDALLHVAGARLSRGLLTVIAGPLVRPVDRAPLVALARAHDLPASAVVLDPPRAALPRTDAVQAQVTELHRTLGGLEKEGFRRVWVRRGPGLEASGVRRVPLAPDRSDLRGPFDFIGDVHGCLPELRDLLGALGYAVGEDLSVTPPPGRTAVFVGDLVDRGPDSAGVLHLVMSLVRSGAGLCLLGNHDEKLARALEGRSVKPVHGLDVTLAQVHARGEAFAGQVRAFLGSLPTHLVLDGGRVVLAHAGLPERYHGRVGGRVRTFALYGDVNGQKDEYGLPVRGDWAAGYRGGALVVYGHTPHLDVRALNGTVNLDTGCAFGGKLSALRYPEGQVVQVPARAAYWVPAKPMPAVPEEARFVGEG